MQLGCIGTKSPSGLKLQVCQLLARSSSGALFNHVDLEGVHLQPALRNDISQEHNCWNVRYQILQRMWWHRFFFLKLLFCTEKLKHQLIWLECMTSSVLSYVSYCLYQNRSYGNIWRHHTRKGRRSVLEELRDIFSIRLTDVWSHFVKREETKPTVTTNELPVPHSCCHLIHTRWALNRGGCEESWCKTLIPAAFKISNSNEVFLYPSWPTVFSWYG